MKRALPYFFCTLLFCISASAQDTLYPVRGPLTGLDTMHVEVDSHDRDHSRFIAEKTFGYSILVEFPTEQEAGFLPDSDARVGMLWIRIENLSKQPIKIDTSSFTVTVDKGRPYGLMAPDKAFDAMINSTLGRRNFLSNASKGISLGRNGVTPEELKDETMRFSLESGVLEAQAVKQGLVFFEIPKQKKYALSLQLGPLWSRPFSFTTSKPKN